MARNKPRHKIDADGKPHIQMCSCGYMNCDPWLHGDTIYKRKRHKRWLAGVCQDCGNEPCKCRKKVI